MKAPVCSRFGARVELASANEDEGGAATDEEADMDMTAEIDERSRRESRMG